MDITALAHHILRMLYRRGGHEVGILATADKSGVPHSVYMGTVTSPVVDRLLTMTAPESRKIANILENPRVEWLFVDEEKEELLYLYGKARVLEEPAEVEAAWQKISDKSRAYFMLYQDVGIQFLIVETEVEKFEYRVPRKNEVHVATAAEIRSVLAEENV
ncbi:MAG TPA: pyridoxamine 5'-phosphate oxidase family protein [Opitutales bacterium]|nr:pyridoxamine 5'-phosphate oxidase family protein [Opitutales bacterium]